ncbi:hypothetical protein [Aquiflexum sp.]|uniref:hypothetical protein n=1 Tax=Aquiflexum sp. TaxID=1872584 RepID=UPI00359318ED
MAKSYQYEQVISVMKLNGGYATLGQLYKEVDVSEWKTKTPFKSINRIVQDDRFFFKIKPGLWALNEFKESILKKFKIEKSINFDEDFSHFYYQGLLIEIGNLKGYQTFVPNQDKNKLFLDKPLKSLRSLDVIFPFAYPNLLRRAQTIDVIWFNNRKMPSSFFEIEHTTDIYNSLLKF